MIFPPFIDRLVICFRGHGMPATGMRFDSPPINVFADGVRSASDTAPLEGVPSIPAGEKMGGQFFPLLFNPETPLQHNQEE